MRVEIRFQKLESKPVPPQHRTSKKTGRKFRNLHLTAARRAWNLARRAWASFCKGLQLRRDVPVGGRDVPVGARPTARQVRPTAFSPVRRVCSKGCRAIVGAFRCFQTPSKGFPFKNSQGTSSPNLKNSENQV